MRCCVGGQLGRAAAETWYVTEEGSRIPALLAHKGARLLIATTPLPAIQERDLAAIQVRVGRALDTAGHSDRRAFLDSRFVGLRLSGIPGIALSDTSGLARLNSRIERSGRCRCAIVVVPAEFDAPNRSH